MTVHSQPFQLAPPVFPGTNQPSGTPFIAHDELRSSPTAFVLILSAIVTYLGEIVNGIPDTCSPSVLYEVCGGLRCMERLSSLGLAGRQWPRPRLRAMEGCAAAAVRCDQQTMVKRP